jgi:hypothetical protein
MVTGTNDRFLQKGVALRTVYEVAEPNLIVSEFLGGPIPEDRKAFPYLYDSYGAANDPKAQEPAAVVGGAELPRIDFSDPTTDAGVIKKKGFEFAIPRDVLNDNRLGKQIISRDMKKAGYLIAQQINTAQLAAMTSGATTPTWTPTAEWSDDDATPVADLIDFVDQMDTEGKYSCNVTDVFMNNNGFNELKKFLTFFDGDQISRDAPRGEMVNRDTVYVGAADVTVHRMKTGMKDGYILGVDKNNPGAEIHYYTDPDFAMTGETIDYKVTVDGKPTRKQINNAGIHFYTYMEDDSKDQILQFWYEQATVVTQSAALLYDTGI